MIRIMCSNETNRYFASDAVEVALKRDGNFGRGYIAKIIGDCAFAPFGDYLEIYGAGEWRYDSEVDFNQVIDYYRAITNIGINCREFIIALLIAERGYMIDNPEDIKPEEVQKLANAVEHYDTIFNEDLNEDIDEIINNPRNGYYDENDYYDEED